MTCEWPAGEQCSSSMAMSGAGGLAYEKNEMFRARAGKRSREVVASARGCVHAAAGGFRLLHASEMSDVLYAAARRSAGDP